MFLLLLAISTAAVDFDYNSPEFWAKAYAIPDRYCAKSMTVQASLGRTRKIAKDCAGTLRRTPAASFFACNLEAEAAEVFLNDVREGRRLLNFQERCQAPPKMAELYYKREMLSKEKVVLESSGSALPGVAALLDAQLDTLRYLVETHEHALAVAVDVTVVHDPETFVTGSLAARPEGSPAIQRFSPWNRRPSSACSQVPHINIEIDHDEREAAERALKSAGRDASHWKCARSEAQLVIAASLSADEIKNKVLGFKGLRRWETRKPIEKMLLREDDRYRILERELVSQAATLERIPHIRALARAEVERLRPNAELLAELGAGTLIKVVFPQKGPP